MRARARCREGAPPPRVVRAPSLRASPSPPWPVLWVFRRGRRRRPTLRARPGTPLSGAPASLCPTRLRRAAGGGQRWAGGGGPPGLRVETGRAGAVPVRPALPARPPPGVCPRRGRGERVASSARRCAAGARGRGRRGGGGGGAGGPARRARSSEARGRRAAGARAVGDAAPGGGRALTPGGGGGLRGRTPPHREAGGVAGPRLPAGPDRAGRLGRTRSETGFVPRSGARAPRPSRSGLPFVSPPTSLCLYGQ